MQWLDDLVRTPCGYGPALNTDKVIKEGGISEGPAAARDAYREHNLSVLGVSGGNRMWLALHGREDTILVRHCLCCMACQLPRSNVACQEKL